TAGDAHVEWLARLRSAIVRIGREPKGAAEAALREGRAAIAAREPEDDHEVLAWAWYAIAEGCQLRSEAVEQQHALERAAGHARAAGELALEVEGLTRARAGVIYGAVSVEVGVLYAAPLLNRVARHAALPPHPLSPRGRVA